MKRVTTPPERDVHLIVNDEACAVYQENSILASGLSWEKALELAQGLGGKIVLHESLDRALRDPRLRRVAKTL